MAELIDPDKLLSVAQIAKKLGYNSMYFTQLASKKRFKAWRIGNTWASTEEIVKEFIQKTPGPGRPKKAPKSRK